MELEQCDPDGCTAFTDKKNVGRVFREKQEQDHEEEDEKGAENAKRQTEARPEGERFAKRAETQGEVAGSCGLSMSGRISVVILLVVLILFATGKQFVAK